MPIFPKRNKMAKLQTSLDVVKKIIGDKWKILIIVNLYNGRKRMNELLYYVDGITQKILTENLRELEKMKLVNREVFAEVPPRTEYSLTEIGVSIIPIIQSLISWSLDYNTAINGEEDKYTNN